MRPGQPTLEHLPHVGQQVPAVGDLRRPRRAQDDAARVLGRAVAGDHLDPRPAPQPVGQHLGGPVGEQVQHAAALQVHQDGAVRAPLAHRPVVHAHDARRLLLGQRQAPDQTQHRVRARRHGQALKQARTAFAPERHPDPPLGLGQPAGAARVGSEQLGQALGEGAPSAGRVAAVKPAHAQVDPERPPERGQIGRAPPITAVHGPARAPAIWAAAAGPRAVRGDVEETRSRHA